LTGFFHTFEKDYVRSYVIRNFSPVSTDETVTPTSQTENEAQISDQVGSYQQHVEISESDHLATVRQMKKQSLYDYGSH
jgi:hypothetical protein